MTFVLPLALHSVAVILRSQMISSWKPGAGKRRSRGTLGTLRTSAERARPRRRDEAERPAHLAGIEIWRTAPHRVVTRTAHAGLGVPQETSYPLPHRIFRFDRTTRRLVTGWGACSPRAGTIRRLRITSAPLPQACPACRMFRLQPSSERHRHIAPERELERRCARPSASRP